MHDLANQSKAASIRLARVDSQLKNKALQDISDTLFARKTEIIQANNLDLQLAQKANLSDPLIKRLKFDSQKIDDVMSGIQSLIGLEDPVGKTLLATRLDQDLDLYKVSCPIGVIGIIFESRPDALVQISTLCLKSGNSVILKGGSEARNTNRVLFDIIVEATQRAGIPDHWITLLDSRSEVSALLKMDKEVDLLIPRGSNSFVRYIMENTKIPVMGHSDGICHCFVDEGMNIQDALRIVVDAKTQYVTACNTLETLLVHEKIAAEFLPELKHEMDAHQVELIGCPQTCKIISVTLAQPIDWQTEYLDYKLSVKVVSGVDEAIDHINRFGSKHTDSILTSNKEHAASFMDYVDSGNVFWNCSTRFSDGFRYGFGAEVGISTGKIHSRGPVGLEGLVIYKYKLIGSANVVKDYAEHRRQFIHEKLDDSCPI